MGKSTLAADFLRAAAIKAGLPSLFSPLELRRTEITMRMLSAEARVAVHHMRTGAMTDDDRTRLARRMPPSAASSPMKAGHATAALGTAPRSRPHASCRWGAGHRRRATAVGSRRTVR